MIAIASPARQAANLANARKSTGPRTPEGKAASRRNAYQHGLAGEGIVLSPEDSAEVELRVAELTAELGAPGRVGQILVHRIASASVRIEKSVARECRHLAERARHAVAAHDIARDSEVAALFDDLKKSPATAARRLLRTPEGIEAAIAAWLNLRDDLLRPGIRAWTARHGEMAVNLTGRRFDSVPYPPMKRLSDAVLGDFDLLGLDEGEGLDGEARQGWARGRLAEMIDDEVEALRSCFEHLDHEAFELDRIEAPERSWFDPSKEATLARRYEAAAERGMFRGLRDLRQLKKQEVEGVTSPPVCQDEPSGSFRAADEGPGEVGTTTGEGPAGPRFAACSIRSMPPARPYRPATDRAEGPGAGFVVAFSPAAIE